LSDQNEQRIKAAENRLAELWADYAPSLKRLAAGMGFGPADVEDIVHEAYLEAVTRPGEYRGRDEARRWLTRVAVNRCLVEFRRRRQFQRSAEEILRRRDQKNPPPSNPCDQAVQAEELEAVRTALQKLDEPLKAPLVLRYVMDLDATEIGRILELNPSTVRSRLRDGRMALAKRLMKIGIRP
jgi:RNA polymerase sigma factor (sigma-70 family)